MALLIYVQDRDVSPWVEALRFYDSTLDIRVFPDVGDIDDITFALTWPFPKRYWSQFPNLKAICSIGAGVNHILEDSSIPTHIEILKLVDKNLTQNMWEYCLGAVMFYTIRFNHYQTQQQNKIWEELPPPTFNTTTIGVMGLGSIGKTIAQNLAQLGFNVKGYSNTLKTIPWIQTYCTKNNMEDFLDDVDIVISLLPLTIQTKGIFNQDFFNMMKQGSSFINVGRAAQVVEEDLIHALDTKQLDAAFLDVFNIEPLEQTHPFWSHPKITITPHVASITNPSSVAKQIVKNYHNSKNGYPLDNRIDRQSGY